MSTASISEYPQAIPIRSQTLYLVPLIAIQYAAPPYSFAMKNDIFLYHLQHTGTY